MVWVIPVLHESNQRESLEWSRDGRLYINNLPYFYFRRSDPPLCVVTQDSMTVEDIGRHIKTLKLAITKSQDLCTVLQSIIH